MGHIDPRKVREQAKDKQATAITGDIIAAVSKEQTHASTCNYEGGANCTCGLETKEDGK